MSWFSNQWNKWSQQLDPNSASNPIRRIQVVWGREILQVSLPEMVSPPTLSDLKAALSSLTDIPPAKMKLIYKGLTLKDDRSSLHSYGLSDGSKVMLVGSNGGPATAPPGYEHRRRKGHPSGEGQKLGGGGEEIGASGSGALTPGEEAARKKKLREEDTSEEGLLNRIEEVRKESRRDLLPKVLQLERSIAALDTSSSSSTTNSSPPESSNSTTVPQTSSNTAFLPQPTARTDPDQAEAESDSSSPLPVVPASPQLSLLQRGTSEMLLRSLLSLDGIQVQSEATRQARKGAVKEIQSWLDRVDAAKERGIKLNWEGKSKV